jgi:hypothetical protein
MKNKKTTKKFEINFKVFLTCCFLFTIFFSAKAQYEISGKIIDAETNESLAFANITFNNIKNKGIISDIDGNFKYNSENPVNKINVSYLGYKDISVESLSKNYMVIKLQPSLAELNEVVVTNGENPALRIIRKVIANREQNNPLKKGGFKYTSYSKSIIDSKEFQEEADSTRNAYLEMIEKGELDINNDSIESIDKTLIKKGTFHIAVLESVTERKFLPPDLSEETVIASRVSGLENAYLSMVATELQPFGFYENNISLLDINFLNPIANGSIKKYNYFLEDTVFRNNDTIFNISFVPKPNANIDGLKGFMYVNSDGYAIQNIVAEPNEKLITSLKIQQKYSQINGADWFPEQLNFIIIIKDPDISIDGKTYLQDIKLIDTLEKKDFSEVALKYEKDAINKDETFWNRYRTDSLSQKEQVTYQVIDSLGKEFKLDKALNAFNSISTGNFPWGFVNVKLNRFLDFNKFEGLRLGAGFETNEKLLENFSVGGYFAFGTKDSNWKFGGNARYVINKSEDFSIEASYSNDVREIGTSSLQSNKFSIQGNPRKFIASAMDIVEQYQFTLNRRDFKYLTWSAALRNEWVRPQYNYALSNGSQLFRNYRNTEAILNLRYAHRERIVETPLRRISLGTTYPIFNLRYTKAFDCFLEGTFDFHKAEVSVYQSFFSKNFGRTRYHLQAGYLEGNAPFGLLFTGEGSYDEDIPVVMYDRFQTMFPYEFLSDRYVNLFLTHDIGSLLFKTEEFNPGVILHHNMSWGDLSNPSHHNIQFNTKDQIFIESGLELTNLLKFNSLGTNMGIGIGGFYRYGYYSLDNSGDNFVYKINISFSLRE